MRTLGGLLAETYAAWLRSVSSCCGYDEKPRQSTEKSIIVLREQPSFIPPPIAAPLWSNERPYDGTLEQERGRLGRRSSSRGSGSTRRLWLSRSVSRRPQISGPSDFRHIQSESFQFPGPVHQQPAPFRPLELSIYLPDNRLSPLLPGLADDEGRITPPPPVHHAAGSRQWDSSSGTLTNDRSYSSMSFHIPRKHIREGSNVSSSNTVTPPRIPPKSRARAYTSPSPSPSPDRLIERIASAMIEKERLQAEIDSVVERQSIYVNSRPSTGHGLKGEELENDLNHSNNSLFNQNPWLMGGADLEPMPSIPALPAAAPSFAERVDNRPRTAPATRANLHANANIPTVAQPMTPQETTLALAAAAFNSHPPTTPLSYTRVRIENSPTKEFKDDALFDRPLAPPLPLVLRPPLRKKKSFSRVSSWLFPGTEDHKRGMSLDSVTNLPRPVKESDGFYQCISPPSATTPTAPGVGSMFEHHHRQREGDNSEDTVSSVSTWETEEDEDEDDEGQTVPTAWSPGSSPVIKNSPKHTPVIERRATFGRGNGGVAGFRPQSVGVAM